MESTDATLTDTNSLVCQGHPSTPGALPDEADYIIVGSGPGGGALAANLALAGYSVIVIEAGSLHECGYYDVPVMQARASEDPHMRWDFFVNHYDADEQATRDPKFVPEQSGVLYPRGSTLGGSSAISAMVTIFPHDRDWNTFAAQSGEPRWAADAMRELVDRLELVRGQPGAVTRAQRERSRGRCAPRDLRVARHHPCGSADRRT